MERLGIIDVGSNSVRLVIIDVDDHGAHHQVENLKETVRLAGSMDASGQISETAISYAVETIRLFANFCRTRRADRVIAVATAAVRRAANREQLVQQISGETGLSLRVLSGEEEAHLGYIGVVNTVSEENALMADLGGGSLKLVAFENRMEQHAESLDFGAVTLTKEFGTFEQTTQESRSALAAFLTRAYQGIPWLPGIEPIIGIGGTFRSLARIIRRRRSYIPDTTDYFEISKEDVWAVYEDLAQRSLGERRDMPGLEEARADIMTAGTAAIYYLLEVTQRPKIIVTTTSIRDGLLYEHLNRFTGDPIVLSVVTHHIDNLINYYRLEENHLRRVSNLAVTLFDQLTQAHRLSSRERRLLLIAGLLHEIGVVIGVEGRDKHTLYMLLNAPLHGLPHRERVMIAYVAASHDHMYLTNMQNYVENGPLQPADLPLVSKLASILQITHSLDRCQTGVVTQVQSEVDQEAGECRIYVRARAGADLEMKEARRKARLFGKLFGFSVHIEAK